MNSNICNNCGGTYEHRHGRWICASCGSYKPENLSSEQENLLIPAFQNLRLAEFEKAENEFNDLIERYPEVADGYWGRLLAHNSITYEIDENGKTIPTCHGDEIRKITHTEDFKNALKYADESMKAFYTAQAEYIDRTHEEWATKASKEDPYDVFISYKESENGERTADSIAAQELYLHLTKRGYRVFYSRESLRDKVGEKYEPYIFHAVSTAKVMIVYGSKPEYIESTWIKNEWKRFSKSIQAKKKPEGSLIVACDGFPPEELPHELAAKQCLDAKQKSFFSDLDNAVDQIGRASCRERVFGDV